MREISKKVANETMLRASSTTYVRSTIYSLPTTPYATHIDTVTAAQPFRTACFPDPMYISSARIEFPQDATL